MLPFLLSLFFVTPVHAASLTTPVHVEAATTSPIEIAKIPTLKEQVSLAFPDDPLMLKIINCESTFRQFDSTGKPLISPTDDVGIGQIHIPTWSKKAKSMGLDIFYSASDNLKMTRYIYEQKGRKAWTCNTKPA